MYLEFDNSYWVIDVEADSLSPTVVWCVCYENCKTEEKGVLTDYEEIRKWFAVRPNAKFVGHNILKFDAPVLNRLVGTSLAVDDLVDTLVLGVLYNPSISGGHSLEAWARRFGLEKIEHTDWSHLSEAMIKRCVSDVSLTKFLFHKLVAVLNKISFSEKSIYIQHHVTPIIEQQRLNGFCFNQPEAHQLFVQLRQREKELQEEIYHRFPPEMKCVRHFKKAYRADGSHSQLYLGHERTFPKIEILEDGSYEAHNYVCFNIGSPAQRVQKLIELGWQPEEFTPKTEKGGGGNPKVTEKGELVPSLQRFVDEGGPKEVQLIAKWIALNARGNMIGTWLDAFNPETGCIHGNLQIAQTLRFRHSSPNSANIPVVRRDKMENILFEEQGYYTYEARNLWTARPGRILVGTDATALEYRMLAHHVNNPELIRVVLERDIHQFTADMAGIERPDGKTLNFAVLYGAGDAKAGKIVKGSAKDGKELKRRLFDNIPGLGEAIEEAHSEFRAGRISLVDGSKIICPSEHASFNYKLQGGGSRVMAQGSIFLDGYIREKGLDSRKVGDIHDEWQFDVEPRDAEEHSKLAVRAIRDAGEELNMNIPMDGKSTIGETWALTH